MNMITLSPILNDAAMAAHVAELREAARSGNAITIICDAVEQVGMAGLQLLASAAHTGRQRGISVSLTRPSAALEAAARLAGMREMLFAPSGDAA